MTVIMVSFRVHDALHTLCSVCNSSRWSWLGQVCCHSVMPSDRDYEFGYRLSNNNKCRDFIQFDLSYLNLTCNT